MNSVWLIWSALWRCQVAHIFVFVAAPAFAALLYFAVGIVFMPFLLVGEGTQQITLGEQANHLSEFGCWVTLMPCSFAEHVVFSFPEGQGPGAQFSARPAAHPEPEAFLPLPTSFTLRHTWFTVWLVWFLIFLAMRGRRKE